MSNNSLRNMMASHSLADDEKFSSATGSSSSDDSSDDEFDSEVEVDSFKDEVDKVTSWLSNLTPCQQIVSVLSLVSTLTPIQKTFIYNHISNSKERDELTNQKEERANSIGI